LNERRVGPIKDMLKKCCEFEVLITISYNELDKVEGRKEKEEEYVKRMVGEAREVKIE
jgi:hypothetical protein